MAESEIWSKFEILQNLEEHKVSGADCNFNSFTKKGLWHKYFQRCIQKGFATSQTVWHSIFLLQIYEKLKILKYFEWNLPSHEV